jgi:hypothetical protein
MARAWQGFLETLEDFEGAETCLDRDRGHNANLLVRKLEQVLEDLQYFHGRVPEPNPAHERTRREDIHHFLSPNTSLQSFWYLAHDRRFKIYDCSSYWLEVAHQALDMDETNPGCPPPHVRAAMRRLVEQIKQAMFGGLGSNTDPPL